MNTLLFLATQLIVQLSPHSDVRGTEITLGEIASLRSASPETQASAEAISLGYTPAPGFARTFQRAQLEQELANHLPGVSVTFEGAAACRAEPASSMVRAAAVRAAAQVALETYFAGRDVELRPDGALIDVQVPLHETSLELRACPERLEKKAGLLSVPVQVWIDGNLYQNVWTNFQVELWDSVSVLARDVRRGEPIPANAFEMRRMKVAVGAGAPVQSTSLIGGTALRDLTAGSVLSERDVQRQMLVRRGDTIEIEIRKGAVSARTSGIATQDGYLGERVRVTLADKKKELSALIVGRGSAQVDLTSGH
jgi:flagellar basal body P-ring formation protein FlgA